MGMQPAEFAPVVTARGGERKRRERMVGSLEKLLQSFACAGKVVWQNMRGKQGKERGEKQGKESPGAAHCSCKGFILT